VRSGESCLRSEVKKKVPGGGVNSRLFRKRGKAGCEPSKWGKNAKRRSTIQGGNFGRQEQHLDRGKGKQTLCDAEKENRNKVALKTKTNGGRRRRGNRKGRVVKRKKILPSKAHKTAVEKGGWKAQRDQLVLSTKIEEKQKRILKGKKY